MSIMEKLGKAANELENAAEEAYGKAKTQYEEKVTPEKRQEIQDKFDSGVKFVEDAADKLGDAIEKGLNDFTKGYNENRKDTK